ncbi:MAG: energy-coupled thiamine transporter ThiT [Clostridia bacterium]|nr:energy-coupled thiamine transporter ThiT [Clostridia bacterium]
MKNKQLYTICECAVLVALSVALCWVEIQVGAQGGSIDFVMIPLFILAYRNGAVYGILSGAVFGLVKCIVAGSLGWGLPSILFDYVLAYGAVGVAGFFKEKSWAIELSTLLGCLARFFIHFLSGITIYMITAPTEIAGMTIASPFLYSIVYNGLYMLPNTVIAVVLMSLLRFPIKRLEKIKK